MKHDRLMLRFSLYGFLKNLRFYEPFMILLFREQGLSFLQIGLLYSIRDVATNIIEIPSGLFADAFGRKKSMLFSLSAYIVSFIIFYLFSGFLPYAMAMLLFAVGEAFRTGTHKALILEYLHINGLTNKVHYYGRTRSASQFGSAVNSLLAAALVFYTGNYRYVFLATTLPYVLNMFNLAAYPKELDGKVIHLEKRTWTKQIKETLGLFFVLVKDRDAMRAILNSASFTAFFKSTKDYLQPMLRLFAVSLPFLLSLNDTRRTAVIIGIVYFLIYMLTSWSSRSSERISRHFSNLAPAINVTFVAGALFLLFAGAALHLNLVLPSILILAGLYVVQNIRKPMNVAYISDRIANKVMASGLSVESQMTTILTALFSPLLGLLADRFGIGIALAGLAGIMLLASALLRVNNQKGRP